MRKAKIGLLVVSALIAVAITSAAMADSKHSTTIESVQCKETYSLPAPVANLSGVWTSNTGGKYYVRQVGGCLYWVGLGTYTAGSPPNYSYANVFFGSVQHTLAGGSIRGWWFDDPISGSASASNHGQLMITVTSATTMTVAPTGGFPETSWTKGPSSYGGLANKGYAAWRCDDSSGATPSPEYIPTRVYRPTSGGTVRSDVIQVGTCVVAWARPQISPKPNSTWGPSSVFFGRSVGAGAAETVAGTWADVPAGLGRRCGKLSLTSLSKTGTVYKHNVGPGGTASGWCLPTGVGPFVPLGFETS